jgi:hypothetical protein
MKLEGVNVGGCGSQTVRLRPMLVLGEQEADVFVKATQRVLENLWSSPAGSNVYMRSAGHKRENVMSSVSLLGCCEARRDDRLLHALDVTSGGS